jgi:hypothetical protein
MYGKQSGEYEIGFALSVYNPLKFSNQANCIAYVASQWYSRQHPFHPLIFTGYLFGHLST